MPSSTPQNSIVIRFSGDSGDGMQLTGTLFSNTSALEGKSVATFPDFPAEIRAMQGTVAGVSGFQVHISSAPVTTSGDYCDVLIAMNPAALYANAKYSKRTATIIVDEDAFDPTQMTRAGYTTTDPATELNISDRNIIYAPISRLTQEALAELNIDKKAALRCKNMFALGICYYLFNFPCDHTLRYLERKFKKKPEIAAANKAAIEAGYNYAANTHAFANTYTFAQGNLPKGKYRMINGNTATAWGLIAAAEKAGLPLFCGSYPITPATTIFEELSLRKDLKVKTMQCEDEIAGICASIGAAFAGHLAVTTTSGPGLALKSEALGLAVMAELPLVVVDVQRGGPSTGLPTKTEQADLMQALWGRNGESPVAVMAAPSPAQCFLYAYWAAKIAVEYMMPVLLLTDGYIANGSEPWLIPDVSGYPFIAPPLVEATDDAYIPYKRDALRLARRWATPATKGKEHRIGGLEKDADTGSVSHNPDNHQRMVQLRADKVAGISKSIPALRIEGNPDAELVVVGWGGTYGHLLSAVDQLNQEGRGVALVHFTFINPMPTNALSVLQKFRTIVVCELNMGQFAAHLRMHFPTLRILTINKAQGQPFTTQELKEQIAAICK
jgi:2-oxoglutarate ferredoxin oxidoreductase subunit alpha